MSTLRRAYTSDLNQLADMRFFVREACQQAWGADGSEETIAKLELAVGKVTVNIILHAYERQPDRPIELVIEADDTSASIWLYHQGRHFDPGTVPPPRFDGSKESGFGVYLIQQLVDEVQYFQDERGHCVVKLYKKRERQPGKE